MDPTEFNYTLFHLHYGMKTTTVIVMRLSGQLFDPPKEVGSCLPVARRQAASVADFAWRRRHQTTPHTGRWETAIPTYGAVLLTSREALPIGAIGGGGGWPWASLIFVHVPGRTSTYSSQ